MPEASKIATHSKIPDNVIDYITNIAPYNENGIGIQEALAENHNIELDDDIFAELMNDAGYFNRTQMLTSLAKRSDISESQVAYFFDYLYKDITPEAKKALAQYPLLSTIDAQRLMDDKSIDVSRELAENPNTEITDLIMEKGDKKTRLALVSLNPDGFEQKKSEQDKSIGNPDHENGVKSKPSNMYDENDGDHDAI